MSDSKSQVAVAESDKIWEEIKNLPIDVFAIAGQCIAQHVIKIELPGTELYVKLASSAVLPALEATLAHPALIRGKKYEVLAGDGYVVIRRSVDLTGEVQKAMKDMKKAKSK